jgi:hypothetical protein
MAPVRVDPVGSRGSTDEPVETPWASVAGDLPAREPLIGYRITPESDAEPECPPGP